MYTCIYIFINLVIGCRFPAGSPDAIERRVPMCHFVFGSPKPLHVARPPPLLVQVTLNSLCSTHKHKGNNICSTLYIVKGLFDLSMWDISQFSLYLSQLPIIFCTKKLNLLGFSIFSIYCFILLSLDFVRLMCFSHTIAENLHDSVEQ